MWFKNIQAYKLPAPWAMTADQLAADLSRQSFTPATSNELLRQGFDAPRGAGLVHVVNGQWLIKLATEKKLLPSSVINQVTKAKAAELEESQGFAPGKKAMRELKERVADELLPRAFSVRSDTWAWIDPVNGWLCIDAASPGKADEVVKLMLKCVDRMPLESLRVQKSPMAMMTAWLEMDEAPAGFTVDQDATLQASGESKAEIRYKRHALEPGDVGAHIKAGKQCRSLAMTWDRKISFTLTESLAIKGIKPLDVLAESREGTNDDRFDSDMALMTGEFNKMLADLVEALGGEARDGMGAVPATAVKPIAAPAPTVNDEGLGVVPAGTGNGDDELYDKAVQIVIAHRRASVSLVQRHLLIGYNRASRLLGAMETKGIVSAMKSNGDRDILAAF